MRLALVDSRRGALALAMTLALVVPAMAQDDVFRRGMDERGDKKWPELVLSMRTAIANDPKESTRKVRGKISIVSNPFSGSEYLPYFYLGEALFNQQDYAGALTAWEESDRQGVARKVGNNTRTITDGYAKCESQGFLPPPKFGDELKAARTAYANANEALQGLAQELAAHPAIKIDAAAQTAARGQIATAAGRLASGEKTRRAQELTDARTLADGAVVQLRGQRELLARLIKEGETLVQNVKSADAELQVAEGKAREVDAMFASSPIPIAPNDRLNIDRARAEQMLGAGRERLRRSGSNEDVAEATNAAREATKLLTSVRAGFEALAGKIVTEEMARLQRIGADGFVRVEERLRSLRDSLRAQPDAAVSSELDKLEKSVKNARRSFEGASKGRDVVPMRKAAGAPTQFELQLEELAKRLGINQPLVVPPALLASAQAQFQGRYADALTALPVEAIDQVPIALRIHAYLVRAAAFFSLYEVSAPRDESLRARARDEADRARQLDAGLQPSAAAFSPRFIRFYQAAAVAAPPQ